MEAAMTDLEEIDLVSQDSEDRELSRRLLLELMKIWSQYRSQMGDRTSWNFEHEFMNRGAMLVARTNAIAGGALLANLGSSHLARYEESGSHDNLVSAIECHAQSVSLGGLGVGDLGMRLGALGGIYYARFKDNGMVEDIDRAIDCNTYGMSLTAEGHLDMPIWLKNLGNAHTYRFERLGRVEDIDNAIEFQTCGIALTPEGHPHMPGQLNNLGIAHLRRFERLGRVEDINNAIEFKTHAVSLTPEGNLNMPSSLNNLGIAHLRRFEQLGRVEDIDNAIEFQTRAVSLTPEGHPDMPTWLNNLGNAHESRFERLGRVEDIDNAIEFQTRAVSLTHKGHPHMPTWLNKLGSAHQCRFERLGRKEDIDNAIEFQTHAVTLTPEGHPHMPGWLNNLGNAHESRFERLGRVEDIDNTIKFQTRAVSLTPEGHPDMPTWLGNLGSAHLCRFERLGRVEDIDNAIEFQTRAVSLTPEGHPHMPNWLNNLGSAHRSRFERLGRVEDIDNAIEFQTHAVSLTPEGHPHMPGWLNNLGNAHESRFERLGRMEDIDNAIEFQTRAVSLTPEGHPDMPSRLNNLGIAHRCRFERLGRVEDIDNAIEFQTRAVSLTPEGHPHMPNWLNNLGSAHRCRFKQLGRVEDMDNAIEFQTCAISLTPEGYQHMPNFLRNLGLAHVHRFLRTWSVEDMDNAIKCFKKSSQTSTGRPNIRFRAACDWAQLASGLNNSDHLAAYSTAMNLVPELIWLGDTIGQRYSDIQTIGDTTLKAAAAAIDAREFDLALEWLEQGRSIVWNQVLQLRNPFDELATAHPSLATNLWDLSDQLHNAGSSPSSLSTSSDEPLSLEEASRKHRRLAGQYDTLLQQIRGLPGFESFLRPKKTSELLPAVQTGPLVVINVHESRCDALVLLPGKPDIEHVPLPELTADKIADELSRLQNSLEWHGVRDRSSSRRPERPRMQVWRDHFADVLATLWSTVAKPVLKFLDYLRVNATEPLPHITWCTTGTLSLMPLHAAGLYDRPGEKLSDYAISSYAPTVGALLQARLPIDTTHSRLLSVGQEATRGQGRLPGTRLELGAIEACAQSPLHCMRVEGSEATCAAVLDALEQHDWVHLACHAHQNVHDPTDSGFFLHDGVLSLATITQKSFKNKGLAFLSACQTATGDQKIADEAVHLASGMLMAGYPSVIATMWSVKDSDAPIIAKEVYGRLLKDGKMDHRGAARALHEAVTHLRGEVGDKAFERWAPFIHIGV
ncbi:aromatic di-alanine and TPR containing protein [Ceratobasidium theobromae]|uniref:Aromatic di-alanine and TPR containing protein n=1 Tax=Ceratobasidium theobromae TaxID=1582974 RepID=A0A5N5QG73_9AGAM|nr:aromatic di-alanine and TPR containing protein [Ceratobasidium theobromae]